MDYTNMKTSIRILLRTANIAGLTRILDEQDIHPDLIKIDGNPMIFTALHYGQLDSIKFLQQRGANIHAFNSDGRNLVSFAAMYMAHASYDSGMKQFEITKFLLECGIDPNNQDHAKYTPLMQICCGLAPYDESKKEKIIEIVKLLIDRGADRDLVNVYGTTAEMCARKYKHDFIADFINKYYPIPDTKGVF